MSLAPLVGPEQPIFGPRALRTVRTPTCSVLPSSSWAWLPLVSQTSPFSRKPLLAPRWSEEPPPGSLSPYLVPALTILLEHPYPA